MFFTKKIGEQKTIVLLQIKTPPNLEAFYLLVRLGRKLLQFYFSTYFF
jgi:hypothetical protein